jgi:hypothetical protein
MVEQLTGAVMAVIVFLSYLMVVQALMAALLLLGQFTILQARALRALVESPQTTEPAPVVDDQGESYRVGGGLLKW